MQPDDEINECDLQTFTETLKIVQIETMFS